MRVKLSMKRIKFFKKTRVIKFARIATDLPVLPFGIIMLAIAIPLTLLTSSKKDKPKLLWASTPIKSLAYMAQSLAAKGYVSHTAVVDVSSIVQKNDFDYTLISQTNAGRFINWMLGNLKAYWFFSLALFKYDIFHYYFDNGLLRRTLLANCETYILKLVRKKLIVMPYGSDAFVYDLIPNPIWRHALLTNYPMHADNAAKIQRRIRRLTKHADVVVGCLVHHINLPRWDILPLTCYPVDLSKILPQYPSTSGQIRIAHAPNHRGVKGSEYLVEAVTRLQQQGHDIYLDIIEKVPNTEALTRIAKADIFVDQLIFGYALAALEGLGFGKIVISGIHDTPEYHLFRQYSYLNECPIIGSSTQTIYDTLKTLIEHRKEWPHIGKKSRQFAENRHSFNACAAMFEAIYQKIWWQQEIDLINYYHPLFDSRIKNNQDKTVLPNQNLQNEVT